MKMPMAEHMSREDLKEAKLKARATVTARFHLVKIQVSHSDRVSLRASSDAPNIHLQSSALMVPSFR